MAVIKVFEYSLLKVGQDFQQQHYEQLVAYNEQYGYKYFDVGNKSIHFKHYVGVFQVGNLVIEVLPKVDKNDLDVDKWHNALIYILKMAGYISIDSLNRAQLRLQKVTLIDFFYKIFLDEVKELIHQGLIRQYRYKEENRPYLKGKIIFSKHLTMNSFHQERFYTSAQVYDFNNVYNQIILEALIVLQNNCKMSIFAGEINNLLLSFENIDRLKITNSLFDNLQYSRKNEKYRNALTIARLILQNYSPDIQGGCNNVVGLFFDMNNLFEKAVFRLLKNEEKNFKEFGLVLHSQVSKEFWHGKKIRPDIVGEYKNRSGNKKFIIDTKWKVPSEGKPSDADLKQMYSYNLHFGALQSVLLYPKCQQQEKICQRFFESEGVKESYSKHSCQTSYLDFFDEEGKIKIDAGSKLLTSLIKNYSVES